MANALLVGLGGVLFFGVLSWLLIGWTDEGAERYPGGTVVRDNAGNILRVSLGPGDTDCRPCYQASRDDWIVKAIVASEGSNFVGIEAAAQGWFGKGAKDLGLGEAAMLAGMVQAPSRFRPDRGYEKSIKRRDYVLGRMLGLGMVSEQQVEGAKSVRPAGSTLKPFLTALAIEKGVALPNDRLVDAPVSFKGFRPANFDGKYRGEVTVREALVESLNVPFVQLLRSLGIKAFGDALRTLGLANLGATDEIPSGLLLLRLTCRKATM